MNANELDRILKRFEKKHRITPNLEKFVAGIEKQLDKLNK